MKKKSPPKLNKLKAKLWEVFTLFIKLKYSIDGINVNCYTCDHPTQIGDKNCQGGHYYSQGGFKALQFNEDNVRVQCYRCNISLNGNTQIFRERLIAEIGESRVKELDHHRHDEARWTRSELLEKIEDYKTKIKELQ